jgi:hypothetical protein
MAHPTDMLGLRIGERVVVAYAGRGQWTTLCDCGAENRVSGTALRAGRGKCKHASGAQRRFDAKVMKAGPCWLWVGSTCDGYGYFKAGGTRYLAHRWLWERVRGPVPASYELDHLCRVRNCVNPDHLEPVSHRENVRRGRLGAVTRERHHRRRAIQ